MDDDLISADERPPRQAYCWKDKDRVCTGECEAFDPFGAEDESGGLSACKLVNAAHVVGKATLLAARAYQEARKDPYAAIEKPMGSDIPPPKVGGQ